MNLGSYAKPRSVWCRVISTFKKLSCCPPSTVLVVVVRGVLKQHHSPCHLNRRSCWIHFFPGACRDPSHKTRTKAAQQPLQRYTSSSLVGRLLSCSVLSAALHERSESSTKTLCARLWPCSNFGSERAPVVCGCCNYVLRHSWSLYQRVFFQLIL